MSDDQMAPHYIIAPTIAQGRVWAENHGVPRSRRVHVTSPDRLRGLNNPTIVWLGYPLDWTAQAKDEARINIDFADRGDITVIKAAL